jgi:hypothetical protein
MNPGVSRRMRVEQVARLFHSEPKLTLKVPDLSFKAVHLPPVDAGRELFPRAAVKLLNQGGDERFGVGVPKQKPSVWNLIMGQPEESDQAIKLAFQQLEQSLNLSPLHASFSANIGF